MASLSDREKPEAWLILLDLTNNWEWVFETVFQIWDLRGSLGGPPPF